jgi:hypothetical protein
MDDWKSYAKKYPSLYGEMVDRVLGIKDAPVDTCVYCRTTSVLVDDFDIPPSPDGMGGTYKLCYDCGFGILDSANEALNDYYRSIL